MTRRQVVWFVLTVLCVGTALAMLHGPIADWVMGREFWMPADASCATVYVMAGGPGTMRARGVADWLRRGGRAERVLVAHNAMQGHWSRKDQRNLTMGEWAQRDMQAALRAAGVEVPVERVAIDLGGTDAEVAALARMVAEYPEWAPVALATSRFHVRRTRLRAARHFSRVPGMIPGAPTWHDHAPWVVASELLKILRDRLGLTSVVRRTGWSSET